MIWARSKSRWTFVMISGCDLMSPLPRFPFIPVCHASRPPRKLTGAQGALARTRSAPERAASASCASFACGHGCTRQLDSRLCDEYIPFDFLYRYGKTLNVSFSKQSTSNEERSQESISNHTRVSFFSPRFRWFPVYMTAVCSGLILFYIILT